MKDDDFYSQEAVKCAQQLMTVNPRFELLENQMLDQVATGRLQGRHRLVVRCASDHEQTEAEAVEGGKEYFAGQRGCQQTAIDAIAALQPPTEAVTAHADLVAARHANLAASRAEIEAAETMDEIMGAIVEPGPAVIETYENWVRACAALQDIATSSGIDADLDCPMLEPTG